MIVSIFGLGYVGSAFQRFFERRPDLYTVYTYDPVKTPDADPRVIAQFSDVILIAVPTPTVGITDLSDVHKVMETITVSHLEERLVILKSTIPPGTTNDLARQYGLPNLVFSPEYLGESKYWTPYPFHTEVVESPWFTFGGPKKATSRCVDLYMPIAGPTKTYFQCDAIDAEMAKYLENAFYATKIAFVYEMYEVALRLGADWNQARSAWLLDPRVGPMHTAVFRENERPFSGKCLPKDLDAIIGQSITRGYSPGFLKAVKETNERLEHRRWKRGL